MVISRITLFVILPIIGAVISFIYFNALQQGTFVKWISFGKPQADKAIKVIWADYVETGSGDLYHYEYNVDYPSEGNWIKSEEVFPPLDSELWIPKERCIDSYNLPSLDKFTDSKIVCEHWGVGISLSITAIDDGGIVYSWRKGIGEYDGILILLSPFIGAILGFLVAIPVLLIVLSIDWIKWLKSRH